MTHSCPRRRRHSHTAAALLVLSFTAALFAASPASAADQMYFPATDNTINTIVNYINNEPVTGRIDISAWYLTEHAISIAIANRFHAGVPVRLIGDRGSIFEIDPNTKTEFYWLANEGVPIRLRYNPRDYPEIDHWKMAYFKAQNTVEFGSANWVTFELAPTSPPGSPSPNYDDETVMFTTDPVLVGAFATKFDQMWNDTTFEPNSILGTSGPPYLKNWYDACAAESCDFRTQYPNPAPMNINTARLEPNNPMPADLIWGQGPEFNNRLVTEINNETSSLAFVIYRLTVDNITQALLSKRQAGLPMQLIIEPNEYLNRKWPEFWLTHANIDKLWAAGVPIKERVHQGMTHMKTLVTSTYATNASSNYAAGWQRDHDYFVSASAKPTAYTAIKNRVQAMWNNGTDFTWFQPRPADAPTLAGPSSGATAVSTTPTLTWNRAAFATSYDVYLGTSQSNLTCVANVPAELSNTPPASYSWTASSALATGTTYYWQIVSLTFASAKGANGCGVSITQPSNVWSFTTSGTAGPPPSTSTPFTGTPAAVPGRIEAENFDNGGENVAYVDRTAGNSGGQYRSTDVDIEATTDTGGGYNVGWMVAGEWLNYTVNVASAGTYTLQARVASSGAGGTFHIEANGVNLTGTLTVPNTGAWQTWTTVSSNVSLGAGTQILRVVLDSNGPGGSVGNLNYFTISTSAPPPPPLGSTPFTGTPAAIPGRIEAENFDNGGQNVAYSDTTTGNSGGQYRTTDVDIEATTDTGGGFNVGWIAPGEWLNYSVSIASAGTYTLSARVACIGPGGTFHVEVGGVNVTGALTIPGTGGWQAWTTVSTSVSLPAGAQMLRVVFDSLGSSGFVGNLNYLQIGSGTPPPPPPSASNIVIYASDVASGGIHGWSKVSAAGSPNSVKLVSADAGAPTVDTALASPSSYVDVTFNAVAGTPYRFWIRLQATGNSKYNDSIWVQFSGTSSYPIGSTSGLLVNLATDGSASSLSGWGWQNTAYWLSQPTAITFSTTGTQTVRVQVREDGVQFDQIVLSPQTYYNSAPGPVSNDATIVPK